MKLGYLANLMMPVSFLTIFSHFMTILDGPGEMGPKSARTVFDVQNT